MGIAIAIIGLIVLGGLVGSIAFGAPYAGVPLVLLFIGAIIGVEMMRRQSRILRMKRFRREARAQPVKFDEVDKRTVV